MSSAAAEPEAAQPRKMGIRRCSATSSTSGSRSSERRFTYQLKQLEARIHILEGFVTIFDALDPLTS